MNVTVKFRLALFASAASVVLAVHTTEAVDVRVEFDKAFDFKSVKTWAWNPQLPGEVKMARTADDDPEVMRKRAEPVIIEAMAAEMGKRGLQQSTTQPQLLATYYLLLTTTASSQTMGDFLPATAAWGLPPFAPATQSLQVMNRGSLVIDFSANGTVVWRGLAQAQLKLDATDRQRESLLRESVRDLIRRYPAN
jgi:hypothetical protein